MHLAWRNNHPDLKELPFPMLADTKRELSTALGMLHKEDGVALRATFIVDPEGVIRFVSVNDLSVGRNVDEVLRVLDALQTDELCPCNWQKGEADPGDCLIMAALDAITGALPEVAKDVRLNLQTVLKAESLTPAQRWGVGDRGRGRRRATRRCSRRSSRTRRPRSGRRGRGRARGGRAHGHEQRLLPVPPHRRQPGVHDEAGAPAHEPAGAGRRRRRPISSCSRSRSARSTAARPACVRTRRSCSGHGLNEDQVHDAVRIGAVVQSAAVARSFAPLAIAVRARAEAEAAAAQA